MKTTLFSFLLFAVLFIGCSDDGDSPNVPKKRVNIELTNEERLVNEQVRDFSFDFIHAFAQKKENGQPELKNYAISPLSLSWALGMVLNGANGETYRQIQEVLGLAEMDNNNINQYMQTMRTALADVDNTAVFLEANSIWMKKGMNFLPDFKQTNKTYYDALLKSDVDFDQKTADAINKWCNEKTKGMIPKFVESSEIDDLKVLLLNALYFKGKWAKPFEPSETRMQNFVCKDGTLLRTPMMAKKGENLHCVSTDDVIIVSLPYGNQAFNMQLLLPADPTVPVEDLLKNLTLEQWNEWEAQKKTYSVTLTLPKFDIDYEDKEIHNVMKALGMTDAFTEKADFSNMSDVSLLIAWIKQRSVIHVDESGTEAAAVTGVGMLESSAEGLAFPTLQVDFNRPFAFFITEVSTNTVLFAGKVGEPVVK
ncbi:MAG: serpin family protein [Parabacteroides sp.]|nr:serpin family protein [Parabacteroides sp.]